MYQDVLVHVPTAQSARPVIDYATSFAAKIGARLDAVAFGYEPIATELAFEGAAAVAAVMEIQRDRASKEATAALAAFEAAAKPHNLAYRCQSFTSIPAEAAETIEQLSRLYDMTIVAQPESATAPLNELVPEAVLFSSGRPVLIVPYIYKGAFDASRVLICWDGKRAAARAVHDALPLLGQAEAVDIIAVNEPEDAGEGSAAALAEHLLRKSIKANVQRITADTSAIYNTILSTAADCGTKLLVMGGYGHSRLREFVLGGVTRGILQSMTIPTLMSH
jgi:nucleotide-binding universal stress UspA family protein